MTCASVYKSGSLQKHGNSGGKLGGCPPRSGPSVQGHPSDSSLSTQHPELGRPTYGACSCWSSPCPGAHATWGWGLDGHGAEPHVPPRYGRHYVPCPQIPVLKSYPHCLRMWLYLVTADEVIRVALIQRDRHTYKTGAFGQTRGWRNATRTRRRLARATERGLRGSRARRPLGRGQLACRPARPWTSAAEVPSRGAC